MNETPRDWLAHLPRLRAAARTGSARAAAAELGLGVATATRQLSQLEATLGVRLFDRSPAGLAPTLALERVLPWAEQITAAADGLLREVAGLETTPVGVVRLAVLPAVSSRFIAPALPGLLQRHPGVSVELVAASAVVDLVRREADVALRALRPEAGDLVVQRLVSVRLAVVAAPTLLDEVRPRTLADLPWLSFDPSLDHVPESQWLRAVVPEARIVARSTDLETLIAAARAGVGALVVAEPLAVVSGGLVPVPVAPVTMPEAPLWLVAHRALRPVPRVAAVWDWLVSIFSERAVRGRFRFPA
jgi:DNA-binding transcriptional LysR family regulator